ncbi:MAG: YceI family protein [Nitrospirota bacterium]
MAKWIIDPDHSVASFVVKHLMVANVRGQFNKISGTIHFDPAEPGSASVEASIHAPGIYTGIQKRDDHLRSPDFFDTATYQDISFRSAKVEKNTVNAFRVTGELVIHGVAREVTLNAEYFGPEKSPYGETSLGFAATITINREDFGVRWNVALESGGVMVGREVKIYLDIEADLSGE